MYTTRGLVIGLAVSAATGPALIATADVVVVRPIKDNSIFSSDDAASNGRGDLFCGTTGSGIEQRCLLAFDVSAGIPAGSTITNVTMILTLVRAPGGGSMSARDFEAHRLLHDWGEGTSIATGGGGSPATSGDATWSFAFFPDANQVWNGPGGDFNAAPSAVTTVSTVLGPYTWGSTAKLVADVQGWLDNPETNFGWIILGSDLQANSARKFASREAAVATDRPVLTVEFTRPSVGAGGGTGLCGSGMMGAGVLCMFSLYGLRRRIVPASN